PAFKGEDRMAGAGTGVLTLVASGRGLAVPAADAAADAFLFAAALQVVRAVFRLRVQSFEVHYRVTPRRPATSSPGRSCISPSMVAVTSLIGLVLPCTLVRMFLTPATTSTSRTPGPALPPVPGPAGPITTRLPPNRPTTRCGMLSPLSDTRFCRF